MNAEKGRLCWSCKHFSFDGGERGYSEYTPGDNASLDCAKNVFNTDLEDLGTSDDLRKLLMTAENCVKFESRR